MGVVQRCTINLYTDTDTGSLASLSDHEQEERSIRLGRLGTACDTRAIAILSQELISDGKDRLRRFKHDSGRQVKGTGSSPHLIPMVLRG